MLGIEEVKNVVKKHLSEKRYNHSICVMERCAELAKMYGADVEKAKLVGMAHDIAKEMQVEEFMRIIKENGIDVDDIEINNIGLLHAKVGATICKNKFGFSPDMVQAIENHTVGKENMDLLSKILFVADATGKDRDWTDLEYAKELSRKDLDATIVYIIDINIRANIERKKQIHPDSILLRNQLISR